MNKLPVWLGLLLATGLSACAQAPLSVSQTEPNLLLRDPGVRLGRGGRYAQPAFSLNTLRNSITQGVLAYYPASSPDNSYSVSNVTFQVPAGEWRQLPFSATVSLIGIAGPGVPVSQYQVVGMYDRMTGRVTSLTRTGSGTAAPTVDPRLQ